PNGLHAGCREETARLRELTQLALVARNAKGSYPGGAIALTRRRSERPLHLLIAPLPRYRAVLPEPRAACIVFVSDPDLHPEPDDELLQRHYGLTATEARVAALLVQGMNVKRVAEEMNVTLNTTRTHLKRVFAKTNTKRQSELVTLVLGDQVSSRLR